jgi:hypothetical protein
MTSNPRELPQGDVRLLGGEVAERLLSSAEPARLGGVLDFRTRLPGALTGKGR